MFYLILNNSAKVSVLGNIPSTDLYEDISYCKMVSFFFINKTLFSILFVDHFNYINLLLSRQLSTKA